MAECDRLQPRDPVAALGAAQRSRQLVADQLAAAIGENRRSIGQARMIRLVAPGGKSSDAAALWRDAPADRSAAGSSGVAETTWLAEKSINKDVRGGAVFAKLQENEAISGFSRTRKQQG